ncbi:hypothetical protein [Rhizobium sp. A37_96]
MKGLPSGGPFLYDGLHHLYHAGSNGAEVRGFRKKVISRFIIPPYVDAYTSFPFLDEDA